MDNYHTRILGVQNPGANIITRCAGTKSHTYDESWHKIECHILTIVGVSTPGGPWTDE
jgi:hypothetical protein